MSNVCAFRPRPRLLAVPAGLNDADRGEWEMMRRRLAIAGQLAATHPAGVRGWVRREARLVELEISAGRTEHFDEILRLRRAQLQFLRRHGLTPMSRVRGPGPRESA